MAQGALTVAWAGRNAAAFAWMEHDHWFDPAPDGGTVLRDDFRFAAPLGVLGRIVEVLVLQRYMTRFLERRNAVIKRVAQSEEWREFLPVDTTES